MAEERRPNWLASVAAVVAVLAVAGLFRLALAQLGLAVDEGEGNRVLNAVFLLILLLSVNVLSMRFAGTSWGSVGQHAARGRSLPLLKRAMVGLAAGLSSYVVALLVTLGSGWMDGESPWLYPTAIAAALAGACVAALALERSSR